MGGLGFSQAVFLAPLSCLRFVVLEGLSALVLLGGYFSRCWRDFPRVLEGWTGPPSSSSDKINCAWATNFPLGFAVEPYPAQGRAGLCFGFHPQSLRQSFDERRGGSPTATCFLVGQHGRRPLSRPHRVAASPDRSRSSLFVGVGAHVGLFSLTARPLPWRGYLKIPRGASRTVWVCRWLYPP